MTAPSEPSAVAGGRGEDPGSIFGPEYRILTIGVVSIMTIVAFEAMGVITAMPTAARELDGLSLYAWGATAVTAASLYAMAAAGGWADRRGPVPPLTTGLGAFVLGTLVCGFAPSMAVLLAGRALQGLGFGAVIVALYVVIGRAYPEHLRPRVFTALSGAWVVPGIVGPLVAGAITDAFGWRWVFFGILDPPAAGRSGPAASAAGDARRTRPGRDAASRAKATGADGVGGGRAAAGGGPAARRASRQVWRCWRLRCWPSRPAAAAGRSL